MGYKLKPCPFCGSDAELKTDIRYPRPMCHPKRAYEVFCTNYDCIIGGVDDRYYTNKEKAIKAWNRRASNENTGEDHINCEAVDAESVRYGRWIQSKTVNAYYWCSYCKSTHKMTKSCNKYVLLKYCPNCGAKMDGDEKNV